MMLDRRWLYGIIAGAALAVVAAAIGLYVMGSSRGEPGRMPGVPAAGARSSAVPTGTAPTTVPSIDVLAERLAQRLKENDGSSDDWALLARSYVQMQRYPEAVAAFGKAIAKNPGNQAFIDEQAAARKAGGTAAPAK